MCGGRVRAAAASSPAPARTPLHPEALARFVDPLPLPHVLRARELRPDPTDPRRQLPYYRVADARGARYASTATCRRRACGLTTARCPGRRSRHEAVRGSSSSGSTSCRTGTSFPSITPFTARRPTSRRFAPWCTCMARRFRRRATATRKTGWCPAARPCFTIPTSRTRRRSGTTITRWASSASTSTQGLLGCFFVRDDAEDALGLPSGAHEIPLVLCDRTFDADGGLHYPTSGDPAAPVGPRGVWRRARW